MEGREKEAGKSRSGLLGGRGRRKEDRRELDMRHVLSECRVPELVGWQASSGRAGVKEGTAQRGRGGEGEKEGQKMKVGAPRGLEWVACGGDGAGDWVGGQNSGLGLKGR